MGTGFINKKIIGVVVFCSSIILIACYYLTQYGIFYFGSTRCKPIFKYIG